MKISDWLKLPELRDADKLDSCEITRRFAAVIRKKPFLKRLYSDWYAELLREAACSPGHLIVEIGSGAGFMKEIVRHVVTSDILDIPGVDVRFSGLHMPFKDSSVKAFFMLDVIHHIADNVILFKEIDRCLAPGGKIVVIEPANTLWARFVWRNFHHEEFNPVAEGWRTHGKDPLLSANSAMPWMIFFRDRARFNERFPLLRINKISTHTPFRYLISGGVSMKQLLPYSAYPLITGIEILLSPLNKFIGMFYTIVIEKVEP